MVYSYDEFNKKMAEYDLLKAEVQRTLKLLQRDHLDFLNVAFMRSALEHDPEYIEKIKKGWTDIDVVIATPDVMSDVGKLGKILGPKGLMPSPKVGTVTFDVGKQVKALKKGKVDSGGSELNQAVDAEAAVANAWQAFEDGIYLVLIDGDEQKDLDRQVYLTEDSELTFIRLVMLAGG